KRGQVQLSAANDQVTGMLTLEAQSEEVAGNMASIARGLIALMKLQRDKPEAAKLAQALTLKQDGSILTLNLNIPAPEALDVIKAEAARKMEKKAEKAKAK